MSKTRKISLGLLVFSFVLYPLILLVGVNQEPVVVNGVIQNRPMLNIYGGYVLTILFLFFLPFSIISLIWPKLKLLIRIIVAIILIWPMWILMFMMGGGI